MYDSVAKGKKLDISPLYLLYSSEETSKKNKYLYDRFGDPFYREVDNEELSYILAAIPD